MVLQARGRVTADAMAEEFEVSVRTIYRDVDELSAAGVPVQADRGPGGGFQLREGYRTQLTGLTPDESAMLLLAGLPGPVADLGFGSALASAERKILAALPASQAARAIETRQRLLLDPLDWYRNAERPRYLSEVVRAVWQQSRIEVRYQSWTITSTRTLEPFGLVIKAGVWYLVARSNQMLRTYKVSQILDLTLTDQFFKIPTTFDLARHWAHELRRFEKALRRSQATIRLSAAGLSRIDRLGTDATAAIRASPPDDSGYRTAEIPIEGIEHAALELLAFGPFVKVIAPRELALRVQQLAGQVSGLYRRQPRLRRAASPCP